MNTEVIIYDIDKVPTSLIDIIRDDLDNIDEDDVSGEIYQEQLDYIKWKIPGSHMAVVYLTDGMIYLGGVALFLDSEHSMETIDVPAPAIQGIARSRQADGVDVKLNSVLIPAIKLFLQHRGFQYLYVNPVSNQRSILEKHYNFRLSSYGNGILVTDL